MSKRNLLISMMLVTASPVLSQTVNDTVRFDTWVSAGDNDLVNFFSNTSWIQMQTTGGITGGALQPPDSISWGNDLITYCRDDVNAPDSVMEVSVSFLYNAGMVVPSAFQRAADVWLFSNVVNHWIIFSVNYNQRLTVLSYFTATDTLLSLVNGHWYRLTASYSSLSTAPGDWVWARAEVFDLGLTGTDPPVSIGHETVSFQDADMTGSDLDIKVSGARKGGGEYLDDFTYHGTPGSTTCILTGISPQPGRQVIRLLPQPAQESLVVSMEGNRQAVDLVVYDASGRIVLRQNNQSLPVVLNTGQMAEGSYVLEVRDSDGVSRHRFITAGSK